jgi:oxygen-independent coproporphyrinogen-3 oxidase
LLDPAFGLYVHVPFCEAKCTYCHFAIDPRRPDAERQERYTRALVREIEASGPARADTIYFGGGTPTLLAAFRLARLIQALRGRFDVGPGVEITVEANPSDLNAAGYAALREAGANRLSLGVQSFDDLVLREMGRLHSGDDARSAVAAIRAAGFESVSLDLILGWPGEHAERWERNLAALASLQPDHVSLYVLEVEGKTLLTHRARHGGLRLPDDDLVVDLYRNTVTALARLGLERYEISNFARPGHASRHNGKYWDDAPFLGFGMSAHSYLDGRRFWNVESYGGYCRALETTGTARAGERTLAREEWIGEALFTGLRRSQGIELARFEGRYGVDPLAVYADGLRDVFSAGLLEVADGRLRLTERGILLSNEVFQVFV